ncbi:MAG: hypothetical protein SGCHY_000591 [Lobulomycetales sp.]
MQVETERVAERPPEYQEGIEYVCVIEDEWLVLQNQSGGQSFRLSLPVYKNFLAQHKMASPCRLERLSDSVPISFISGSPTRLVCDFIIAPPTHLMPNYSRSGVSYHSHSLVWTLTEAGYYQCRERGAENQAQVGRLQVLDSIPWISSPAKAKESRRWRRRYCSGSVLCRISVFQFTDLNSIVSQALSIAVFHHRIVKTMGEAVATLEAQTMPVSPRRAGFGGTRAFSAFL